MAYMIYQRYADAIREGYAGNPDVASRAKEAKTFREWLEGLEIDKAVRDGLVEQARSIEEAFEDLSKPGRH